MTKLVYRYSHINGEYLGSQEARISPLEPDVYLLPAHCTFDAPPKKQANKVQVFIDGEWQHVVDHRGKNCWDTQTLVQSIVDALGELPETVTLIEPTYGMFSKWGGEKWVEDLIKINVHRKIMREGAYVAESDPLFFKWQRGEGTEQAWLDKVAEIKQRYSE